MDIDLDIQIQNFLWCVFNKPEWAEEWLRREEHED